MQPGKWTLILVLFCLFTHQLEGACLINPSVRAAVRLPRMTPFWRGLSLRPLGASCRDASECLTRLLKHSILSLDSL
uniref:Liver-expressed antimicrobial peptide 2 n=1 Tax=Xenopus tropicalis TaxID=8364 RepID=A0A6I8PRT4_XENTR